MGYRYGGFAPYVSVAKRRQQAAKKAAQLKKKGQILNPVNVEGRTIAKTFWGKAWCDNLESYSDYSNRLPRGRTYVRNGSVIDLQVKGGEISALVSGSSIYKVNVNISTLPKNKWNGIVEECSGKIDSLIKLLQGKFSKGVMEIMTRPEKGLFPHPKEIKLACSCPDWADMCKHVAAVLYGIGARLDQSPEALFLLRQADHLDLIAKAGATTLNTAQNVQAQIIPDADLSSLFGIDIDEGHQKENKPIKVAAKKEAPIKKSATRRKTKKSVIRANTAKKNPATSTVKKKKIKADLNSKTKVIKTRNAKKKSNPRSAPLRQTQCDYITSIKRTGPKSRN